MTAAPALVPLNTKPRVEMLKLEQINESPTNPRRQVNKEADAELTKSITENGVLQPVLVRPQGDGVYELVFGHRRLRACWAAKLEEIPAMVRDLDDRGTLEAQLIENRDREDVHPLDEADAFQRLHEQHKVPIEEIVAKLGKSRSYVYQRLSLTKMTAFARKAFLSDEVSPAVAQMIARVPENLQKQATERVVRQGGHNASWARDALMREFMLGLADAPWKLDEVLGQKACTTCPSRTGNQRELFADIAKSDDMCTDPTCFNAKKEAKWKQRAAEAREKGQTVLEGAAAKKIADALGSYGGATDVVKLDAPVDPHDYGPKAKTWRQVLGKSLPTPILVKGNDGKPLEVLDKAAAKGLLKKLGVAVKPERAASSGASDETARRKKYDLRKKVVRAAIGEFIKAGKAQQDEVLDELVRRELSAQQPGEMRPILLALLGDEDVEPGKEETRLAEHLVDAPDERTLFLLLARVIPHAAGGTYNERYAEPFADAAQALGVDLKKLEAQVKAEEKAAAAAKGKKKAGELVVRLPAKGKKRDPIAEGTEAAAADNARLVEEFHKKAGTTPPKKGRVAVPGTCAVPGCQPQLSTEVFCADHDAQLNPTEQKALLARAKKLAAEAAKGEPPPLCTVASCGLPEFVKKHGAAWCSLHQKLSAGEMLEWIKQAEKSAKRKGGQK